MSAMIWTLRSGPATSNGFRRIAWSPSLSLFCAGGGSSATARYATSPDGVTWTYINTGGNSYNSGLVWTGSVFVALGPQLSTSCVQTSPDGATWTTRTAQFGGGGSWLALAYSPSLGRLVATGNSGRIMSSDDNGVTWTFRTAPAASLWTALAWSPDLGLFSCLSNNNGDATRGMYSSDGITWTGFTGLGSSRQWASMAWSPSLGLFAATDPNNNFSANVATSPDGFTWTIQTTPSGTWRGIAWSAAVGRFVAVGPGGSGSPPTLKKAMTSSDGINWAYDDTPTPDHDWYSLDWSASLAMFVAVNQDTGTTQSFMSGVAVAAPTVVSVSPSVGSASGGTAVTITGTGFSGTPTVTFGGVAAVSVIVVSSTQIVCVTPPHASGVVDVVVTGVGTGAHLYTYTLPVPQNLGKGPLLPPLPTRSPFLRGR